MNHVFVSTRVPSSAAWLEAFPSARVAKNVDEGLRGLDSGIVWLHLGSAVGLDALKSARTWPSMRIVVMSDTPADEEGLSALDAGAIGYCNSNAAAEVLLQIADVVARDGLWVGASLLNRLLRQAMRDQPRPRLDWDTCLTPRESEIARAAARGLSNRDIATQLGITERTVKAHLTVVFEKLQLKDRLQLSLYVHGVGTESAG